MRTTCMSPSDRSATWPRWTFGWATQRSHAGVSALVCVLAAARILVPSPAGATFFRDVRNILDTNSASVVEEHHIDIHATPARLEVLIPRSESLPGDGEVAVYNQWATVTCTVVPAPDYEDRSQWYTRFVWTRLAGVSRITIRATTDITGSADIQGVSTDLTRYPGAFYTDFTPTIQYVPGIDETIRALEGTMDDIRGYPGGDIGLAQRWAAYLLGTFSQGSCPGAGIDDAAGTWASGLADCDGFSNVFVSGLRSLGIPACVMIGYNLPGGPVFNDFALGGIEHGLHAWAGAWSEGLQAFLPVDPGHFEYGLVDAQRVHFAYHEDLASHRRFFLASGGSVSFGSWSFPSFTQSNSSTHYGASRVRLAEDGFGHTMVANEVTGVHAPGGNTGVPEPDSTDTDAVKLLVSSPFRAALTVSVLSRDPTTITVEIFDALGRRVAVPADAKPAGPGESFFRWLPGGAAAGVYFVRATTREGTTRLARAVLAR